MKDDKEKQKSLLIEMMKEDEKNGMYEDYIPDSGKMMESQDDLSEAIRILKEQRKTVPGLGAPLMLLKGVQSRIEELEKQIEKYKAYCEGNGLLGL